MWIVVTKFNAFYVSEDLEIPKTWESKFFKPFEKSKKDWAILSNCWKITKAKKLFYNRVSIDMRYVLTWDKVAVDTEKITFNELIEIIKRKKKW